MLLRLDPDQVADVQDYALRQGIETIRGRVSREWRKNLNAALKSDLGLRISVDRQDSEWLLDRHAQHMRSRNFSGPGVAFVRRYHEGVVGVDRGLRIFGLCLAVSLVFVALVARPSTEGWDFGN